MSTKTAKPENGKKKRNAQASRNKLLEAAIEVFSRHGPEAATIDEICGLAGLNKRLAYHYFSSKEGLYREALRVVYERFFALDVALSSMLLPAEQLLELLVRRYYEFLSANQRLIRMISFENLNEGRVARGLNLQGQKAPVITAIQLALAKGQAEKRFREGIDVTELLISIFALTFFYFSNQYTLEQMLGRPPAARQNLENRIKHVVSLVLHGIAHEDVKNGDALR